MSECEWSERIMKNRNAPEPDNIAPDVELLLDYFFDYREYGLILML